MSSETIFVKPDNDIMAEVPVTPLGWRVLVRPYEPEAVTSGGIHLADETLDNSKILTTVGEIVAMGNLAFTAKTRSQIDMAAVLPQPKVGDWVMYGAYGGVKMVMRNGNEFRLMNDDAILAIATDPKDFKIYT